MPCWPRRGGRFDPSTRLRAGAVARRVSRPRRHDHRRGRLSRSRRARRTVPVEHRRDPRAQPRRAARRDGHEPVRRRARILQRSGRRRGAPPHRRSARSRRRAHRRVLLLSAPPGRQGDASTRRRATAASRGAASSIAPSASSASTRPPRSSSATDGSTWRWRARSAARGVLVRTGYGATEETRPPEGLRADAIADNLIGAVSWILGKLKSHSESEIRNPKSDQC